MTRARSVARADPLPPLSSPTPDRGTGVTGQIGPLSRCRDDRLWRNYLWGFCGHGCRIMAIYGLISSHLFCLWRMLNGLPAHASGFAGPAFVPADAWCLSYHSQSRWYSCSPYPDTVYRCSLPSLSSVLSTAPVRPCRAAGVVLMSSFHSFIRCLRTGHYRLSEASPSEVAENPTYRQI